MLGITEEGSITEESGDESTNQNPPSTPPSTTTTTTTVTTTTTSNSITPALPVSPLLPGTEPERRYSVPNEFFQFPLTNIKYYKVLFMWYSNSALQVCHYSTLKKIYTLHFVIQLPGQARTPLCHPSPRKLRPGSLQHLQPQHLTEKISKSALTMCLWCYHNSWCLLYTWISNENKHVNIFGGKYKYQPLLKLGITLYLYSTFLCHIYYVTIYIFQLGVHGSKAYGWCSHWVVAIFWWEYKAWGSLHHNDCCGATCCLCPPGVLHCLLRASRPTTSFLVQFCPQEAPICHHQNLGQQAILKGFSISN